MTGRARFRAVALGAGLLLLCAARLPAGDHPAPDVYFFYELRIERGRLYLLHETRWTDLLAQELLQDRIDQNGDGLVSESEGMAFARQWSERVLESFRLEVQGDPVDLGEPELNFATHVPSATDLARAGTLNAEEADQAGLEAYLGTTWEFRVYLDFEIPLPAAAPVHLDLYEETYQEESEKVQPWATNAISAYGEAGLSFQYGTEPDDPRYLTPHIELVFDWSGRGPALFEWKEFENPDEGVRDLLAEIIQGKVGLIVGLGLALLYGMLHALAPGHGKAMVAAYLIGTRGRPRDAVSLGLIVTFTHTFSIMAVSILAGLFLKATEIKLLEQWLGIASGLGILGIGAWLLLRNGRAFLRGRPVFGAHPHHLPDSAHHHHDHGHGHDHDHDHDHEAVHAHSHPVHGSDSRDSHSGHPDHHRVPTSLKELLALGVTGGMVPCPAAVVVFLWALQNDYPWTAALVVGTFSLGLAVVLVIIGLLMVSSTRTLEKLSRGRQRLNTVLLGLPVFSAVVIVTVGALVTYAAWQIGPR